MSSERKGVKDRLIENLDNYQKTWDADTLENRRKLLEPFVNKMGLERLPAFRFEILPEILQLILVMVTMDNPTLDELAIKEGYLDQDARAHIHRNIIIVAIAGSITRGSTATETSAYRRTGTTRWSKMDDD